MEMTMTKTETAAEEKLKESQIGKTYPLVCNGKYDHDVCRTYKCFCGK
jgi:hypothetical protein